MEKELKTDKIFIDKEEELLLMSAEIASSKAIRSSLALGLTIKFIEDNSIVEVSSKGRNVVRRKKASSSLDLSKLKKGIILKKK